MLSKPHTIYLNRTHLFYIPKETQKSGSLQVRSLAWDEASLVDIFEKIKSTENITSCKVLVSEDISFTTSIPYTEKTLKREHILDQFQQEIPEIIDQTAWDYKVIAQVKDTHILQLFSVESSIWKNIQASAKKAGLELKMIIPSAYTLAHHLPEKHAPALVIYPSKEESFAAILVQNHVFGVVTFDTSTATNKSIEKISQLVAIVEKKYAITPTLLLLPKVSKVPDVAQPFLQKLKRKGTIPHPLIVLHHSKIEYGADKDILTLSVEKNKKKHTLLIVSITFSILMGIALSLYFLLM